jgi:hypothetical protein
MKQLTLQGNAADPKAWEAIKTQFQNADAQWNEWSAKRAGTMFAQGQAQIAFLQQCSSEVALIARLVPPALVSARKELELHVDAAEYQRLFNENADLAARTINETIAELQNAVQPQPPQPPDPA